jgi:tRNA(Ile2) C34 agmatinyltransferase TiaS
MGDLIEGRAEFAASTPNCPRCRIPMESGERGWVCPHCNLTKLG